MGSWNQLKNLKRELNILLNNENEQNQKKLLADDKFIPKMYL